MGILKVASIERVGILKVRVTFSEAPDSTALTPANYSVAGLGAPVYVAQVSSLVYDLHYGTKPAADANTIARWAFENADNDFSAPTRTSSTGLVQRGWNTYVGYGYGTVDGGLDSSGLFHLFAPGQTIFVQSSDSNFNSGVSLVYTGINNNLAWVLPGSLVTNTAPISYNGKATQDTSGNGYNLWEFGAVTHVENGILGRARRFGNVGLYNRTAFYSEPTLVPRTAMLGDVTIDAFIFWDSSRTPLAGDYETVASYGGTVSIGQAENILIRLLIKAWTGKVCCLWDNATTSQVFGVNDEMSQVSLAPGIPTLVTVTRTISGSTAIISIYINGELRQTVSERAPLPDGGTSNSMRWAVGAHTASGLSGTATTDPFNGEIAFVRVSDIARSADSIKVYADALLGQLSGLSSIDLQVQNVQDLATSTPIQLANGVASIDLSYSDVATEEPVVDVNYSDRSTNVSQVWDTDAILGELPDSEESSIEEVHLNEGLN